MVQQVAPSIEVLRTVLTHTKLAFDGMPTQSKNELNGLYMLMVNSTFEQLIAQAKFDLNDANEAQRRYYGEQFQHLLHTIQFSCELAIINEELAAISKEATDIHLLMKNATTEAEREALKPRFFATVDKIKAMQPRIVGVSKRAEDSLRDLIKVLGEYGAQA